MEAGNNLLDPIKETLNPPRKSYRFDVMSLYYDGVYYFPEDIRQSSVRENKPWEIQAVYFSGKWRQDTFYITEEFKNFLIKHKN